MSKTLTLVAFFLILSPGLAQETWYSLIPYETSCPNCTIRRLVSSSIDGGLYILVQNVDTEDNARQSALLYKYSSSGEYQWEKNYDLLEDDSLGYGYGTIPYDMIELPGGILVICGLLDTETEQGFLLKLSAAGDILDISEDEPGIKVFNELEYFNAHLFVSSENATDTSYIHEIHIPSLSIPQVLIESPSKILSYEFMQDAVVIFRAGVLEAILGKYNFQGDLLVEKYYSSSNIIHKFSINITRDELALYCKDTLWVLDSELEKQNYELIKNVQALGPSGGVFQSVYEFQGSSDGGYLAVGSTAPFSVPAEQYLSFVIVLNADGSLGWGNAYGQFYLPLTTIKQIEEANDGYVVVGGHSASKKLWLIKLTKEGLLGASDKPKEDGALEVFPNPFCACFEVSHNLPVSGKYSLRMHDLQGRLLLEMEMDGSGARQVCQPGLPGGVYLLSIADEYGRVFGTAKVIKD